MAVDPSNKWIFVKVATFYRCNHIHENGRQFWSHWYGRNYCNNCLTEVPKEIVFQWKLLNGW